MKLDALIIAAPEPESLSAVSDLRLSVNGRPATIQQIRRLLNPGTKSEDGPSWLRAPHLNGIAIYDHCIKSGFNCDLIDAFNPQKTYDDFKDTDPLAVVISTSFIISKKKLEQVIQATRRQFPDAVIIAGGTFVYASYLLACRQKEIDYDTASAAQTYLFLEKDDPHLADYYIISSSGLGLLAQLLGALKQKKNPREIPGIATSTAGGIVQNGVDKRFSCERIDIDWAGLPDKFFSKGVIGLQASRGCPYRCRFCNFQRDASTTYVRPLNKLIEELKAVQSKGVKYVRFVDDNFRLGHKNLDQVCKSFLEAGVNVKWSSFIRLNHLLQADLDLLRQSGCTSVQVGLESASQEILDNMNKKVDGGLYQGMLRRILYAGLDCSVSFLLGFPGESTATVKETLELLASMDIADAAGTLTWTIYPFLLAPLSPIYEPSARLPFGLEGYGFQWRHNTMDTKEAVRHIFRIFMALDRPTPTYSGDNLNLLYGMPPDLRKNVYALRHALAKDALQRKISPEHIIRAFKTSRLDTALKGMA